MDFFDVLKKIKFNNIPKGRVVVLDQDSADVFLEVLAGEKVFVLPTRGEVFFFPLKVLFWFLVYCVLCVLRGKCNQRVGILFYGLYICAVVRVVDPKVVVTQFEYCPAFRWASRFYTRAPFFAFQRCERRFGLAEYLEEHKVKKKDEYPSRLDLEKYNKNYAEKESFDVFVCFGERDISERILLGHEIASYHALGSLKAGYYFSLYSDLNEDYDVCIVSEAPEHVLDGKTLHGNIVKKNLDTMLFHLAQLSDKYKICISLRSKDRKEMEYYEKIFGRRVTYFPRCDTSGVYLCMTRSKIIFAICSTCLLEAFGWGKKVIACNLTGLDVLDIPIQKNLKLCDPSLSAMREKIDYLYNMDIKSYLEMTKFERAQAMNFNQYNLPHLFLKKILHNFYN